MAVIASKRGESGVQFIETAYQLELHTIKTCMKLPKRLTFFLSTHLVDLASDVYNHCKMANSIYVTNEHELQMRVDHLTEANAALQTLIGKVNLLHELQHDLSDFAITHWNDLMIEEAKMISTAKKNTKDSFKKRNKAK